MNRSFFQILTAGALATIAFDLFDQGLSPLFGFAKLAPVGLANGTLNAVFGSSPKGAADALHIMTGLLAYPLGYLLIARHIAGKILPNLHWSGIAIGYGIGLWVFALYGMAHLVAGLKPFLVFTGITWVALWGHILFALVAAWVLEREAEEPAHA